MNIKEVTDDERIDRSEVADMLCPTGNTPTSGKGRLAGRFRVHTPDVHAFLMNRIERKSQRVTTMTAVALPELKPWLEVGWIFQNGNCIAIECKGEETRTRLLVD